MHAYRAALNHLTQSGGADICFNAVVRAHEVIRYYGFHARMLMTVHDSLVFTCPTDEIKDFVPAVRKEALEDCGLDFIKQRGVKIDVDVKVGPNFGDLIPFADAMEVLP